MKNKNEIKLFTTSLIISIILGLILTYNFDFTTNNNFLFDSDTSRVIKDSIDNTIYHSRISVHPLYLILIQPIALLIKGIVLNKILALIILSSIISSLSIIFIYKILNLINNNEKINILLSLIYLFSFSNIIYTAGIEVYNTAALFLILLMYYSIKKLKEKDKINNIYKVIILSILGTLSFGITLTNYIIFLIVIFTLFISKYINLKNSILTVLFSLLLIISLNITQKIIWYNVPLLYQTDIIGEKNTYSEKTSIITKINNVIKNDYSNSIISSNIKLNMTNGEKYTGNNLILDFSNNYFSYIIMFMFIIITIILIIRNIKKDLFINIILLLSLSYNSLLHLIYGNNSAFLYSLHFLYLLILLLGININNESNKELKIRIINFSKIFLIIEIITNIINYIKIINISYKTLIHSYFTSNLGLIKMIIIEVILVLIISIIIYTIYKLITKLKKIKNKDKKLVFITSIITLLLLIPSIFITINTIQVNNKFLIFNLTSDLKQSNYSRIDTLSSNFKNTYKEEIKLYKEYLDEYKEIQDKYTNTKLNTNNLNWKDYYYFGLGNRNKYLYKDKKLIDINTNKVIYNFNELNHLIIPNLNMVLIETNNNKFIKIYEDNKSVKIIINNKEKELDNTNISIDLYDFSNQKYKHTKKVLYNEILFNIKDSTIYPNIFVYNKPWYRDAAITTMVLKNTNNTNLISSWVDSITDIYDLQNNNVKEPDNLGELLYIISSQETINYDLVTRIEEEAERLASSNEQGYYLYGQTDFQDMYLYQNLWYKLGIESIGKEFKFDLSSIPEDRYSCLAWWSSYKNGKNSYESDENYPYRSIAARHNSGYGNIILNNSSYPLSWEKEASEANYNNYYQTEASFAEDRISPIHSWTSSELLLFLLDETNDLKNI